MKDLCQFCGWEIAKVDWYHRYNGKLICDNCVMDTMSERERGSEVMEELSEQIQSDLITYLDGFSNEIIDGVCKIITDRFKGTYE